MLGLCLLECHQTLVVAAGSKVSQHMLTAYARAVVNVIESQYTAKQLPGYAGTS